MFLKPCISQRVSGSFATPCGEGNLKLAKFLIEDCGATLRRDRFGLLPIHDAATRKWWPVDANGLSGWGGSTALEKR